MITPADVGRRVDDGTGRVGVLREVMRDYEDPAEPPLRRRKRAVAFLRPEDGGKEWIVPLEDVTRAEGADTGGR
ncbi:hypothetical protein EF906_29560 [Streptomyces sp. WAC08241]|nr:hypothetical protein EF906_29560 [Streptomyces sp. WAC08241]